MKKLIIALLFILTFAFVACVDPERPEVIFTLEEEVNLYKDQSHKLIYELTNANEEFEYELSKDGIIEIDNMMVKGLSEGEVTLTITVKDTLIKKEVKVTIKKLPRIIGDLDVEVLANGSLSLDISDGLDIIWSSSDESVLKFSDGSNFATFKEGIVNVKAKTSEYELSATINVHEPSVPTITFENSDKLNVNWNDTSHLLDGVKALDAEDGDITDKIVLSGFDIKEYGDQKVCFEVTDTDGHKVTAYRDINVSWNYDITFIGHAGSYFGVMNTEQAFLYAVQNLHYQALECDLSQTKDGVFVLCHDADFGGVRIGNTNWSEMQKVTDTKNRHSGYPQELGLIENGEYTSTMCTLARYLEICKEYNAQAIIELKDSKGIGQSDQSRMQALMNEIEKAGMLEHVTFLGSNYNCLIWTRKNGYDYVPCQYLVNSCDSQTVLDRCIEYDLDLSINAMDGGPNSDEWLAKYHEAGLEISAWTFSQYVDYETAQKWIDKGIDYITTDWHHMDELELPLINGKTGITHEVVIKDLNDVILRRYIVKDGDSVKLPKDPIHVGYLFKGWSNDGKCVTSDLEIVALFDEVTYKESKINYVLDGGTINDASYPTTYQETVGCTLPKNVSKEGYKFLGWSLNQNIPTYVSNISYTETGDITLYAFYKEIVTGVETLEVGTNKEYQTLQAALDACKDGDIIVIYDGTHTVSAQYNFSKAVTILGPNEGISGDSENRVEEAIVQVQSTVINTPNLVFDGLKIVNAEFNVNAFYVNANTQNFVVRNCVLFDFNSFLRIDANTGEHATFTIENCKLEKIAQFLFKGDNIQNVDTFRFVGNYMINCGSVANTAAGWIRLKGTSNMVAYIENNTFDGDLTAADNSWFAVMAGSAVVKYNAFKNTTRIICSTNNKPITFDYNIYYDKDGKVLDAAPSQIKGTGVTKDIHVCASEVERLTEYANYLAN